MDRGKGKSAADLFRAISRQAQRAGLKYGACRTCRSDRQLAILAALRFLAEKFGKTYARPSQAKILEILGNVYRVSMSRRTLNRDLAELADAGVIKRIRRHRRGPGDSILFTSTAYYVLDRVRAWTAAARKRLAILGFDRVPKLAQHRTLAIQGGSVSDRSGPDPGQSVGPAGQIPDPIPC